MEVAKLIAYLSGNDARFITGAEFIIDGGQSI
jgi:NAD(P)-dependent dehydrogenase (short-subunit alcohol dehydrogenase family)